ncbi:MAG: hypothetical protein AB1538_00390 [Bacillota bacterium]
MTGATMAFRAEFKELILPIPASWVHDGWIALIIAFLADLAIIHEPLIKYRQHSKKSNRCDKKRIWTAANQGETNRAKQLFNFGRPV